MGSRQRALGTGAQSLDVQNVVVAACAPLQVPGAGCTAPFCALGRGSCCAADEAC